MHEAAAELGTTVEAVRHRIRRGTLTGEKVDGTVYVILDVDYASTDQPGAGRNRTTDQPQPDELVEGLRDHIADLRQQLASEREANRENRRLLAAALERIPELPQATPPEPRGAREPAADDRPGTHTPASQPSPQTGARPRSWWRRLIGS